MDVVAALSLSPCESLSLSLSLSFSPSLFISLSRSFARSLSRSLAPWQLGETTEVGTTSGGVHAEVTTLTDRDLKTNEHMKTKGGRATLRTR